MIKEKVRNFFMNLGFKIWTVDIDDKETHETIGTIHFLFKFQAKRYCDKNEHNFFEQGYTLNYGGERVFFFGLEV